MSHEPWRFTLLGYPLGFAEPTYLGLLVVALLVLGVGVWVSARRRRRAEGWWSRRFVTALAPAISEARPVLQAVSVGLGLCLLSVALAQPQCGSKAELTKRRGIDLVVALDASKSMLARDITPNRLERAKLELTTLLEKLRGDRVGLVVFAGDAFIQCPLTSDYSAAKMFLKAVEPEQMQEGGTNIGEALELSKKVLDSADRGSKDKVVVLLSDGEDLEGGALRAAEELKRVGILVFAVGIGSDSGEPIPLFGPEGQIQGYLKDPAGETVLSRLDRAGLEAIADQTGGEFFYQPKSVAIGGVVDRIEKLQKSELESRLTLRYDERYQAFAFPGLWLLFFGMTFRTWKRERS